jgi:RHS repeat-associated protein
VIEGRVGGSSTASVQYVWCPLLSDTLVERDRDPNGGGTLSERLYAQQDANGNVTALVDTSGNVQERYVYDPFGTPTILDANWNPRGSSSFAWGYLFQGLRYDPTSGLYDSRHRDYSPTLGRFLQQDPLGFQGGDTNPYRYAGNDPVNAVDPTGLQAMQAMPAPAANGFQLTADANSFDSALNRSDKLGYNFTLNITLPKQGVPARGNIVSTSKVKDFGIRPNGTTYQAGPQAGNTIAPVINFGGVGQVVTVRTYMTATEAKQLGEFAYFKREATFTLQFENLRPKQLVGQPQEFSYTYEYINPNKCPLVALGALQLPGAGAGIGQAVGNAAILAALGPGQRKTFTSGNVAGMNPGVTVPIQ